MVHPCTHILDDFFMKNQQKSNIYEYIVMSRSNFIYVAIRFSSEGYITMHVNKNCDVTFKINLYKTYYGQEIR